MKRDQVIRMLREEAKALGWSLEIDMKSGKGSHYRLYVTNGKNTVIKSGELSPLYIEIIRKQLGLK